MEVMRHSDIKLTTKTYTDAGQLPTADALESLPRFDGKPDPQQSRMKATGTDNATAHEIKGGLNGGLDLGHIRAPDGTNSTGGITSDRSQDVEFGGVVHGMSQDGTEGKNAPAKASSGRRSDIKHSLLIPPTCPSMPFVDTDWIVSSDRGATQFGSQ